MKTLYISLIAAVMLASACSDAKAPKDAQTQTVETVDKTPVPVEAKAPMVLVWDDLMPVGEEALLAEMYTEYYEDLESRMIRETRRLQDLDKETVDGEDTGFDINSISEGASNDTMEQIGTFNVVTSLNDQNIRIPGYVVPLDFNARNEYKEFLLVPYFGACLHTPPPPPNQILFVKSDKAVEIKDIREPVWLEGRLNTGEFTSDLADTAYELSLSKLEAYEY